MVAFKQFKFSNHFCYVRYVQKDVQFSVVQTYNTNFKVVSFIN